VEMGRAEQDREIDRPVQARALPWTRRGIRPARLIAERDRGTEDIGEHFRRQPPRVRVVARAVIAIDEMAPVRQHMDGTVCEGVCSKPLAESP